MSFRAQLPTVGIGSTLAPKPFVGSYSKLKNFETCAKRSYHIDVKRDVEEEKTDELKRGDALHGAMASRVRSEVALPIDYRYMEPWAKKLTALTHPLQTIQVELRLGLSKQLKPTLFMEKTTYWRSVIDYLKLIPSQKQGAFIGHIVDYKTGRPKEDFDQLAMYALAIFIHCPDVVRLRAEYIWTEYNDTSHEDFEREEAPKIWADILPRVLKMEAAYAKGIEAFPANPCGLCKEYCPVRTCEHNGRRIRA